MDLEKIRRCEDHWRELFAEKRPFNANLDRWHNQKLTDQYTTNAFFPKKVLCRQDVAEAYAFQQKQTPCFLQIMCRQPMDRSIMQDFALEETVVQTMAVKQPDCSLWKNNPLVIIKDVQIDDIAEELIRFSIEQECRDSDYFVRAMRQDMDAARQFPEYHWFAAYLNGEIVGICHGLDFAGCVEIDDLVVAPQARKQYVATTLLRHIAENFSGIVYLHADEDDTPKQIYEKMGFIVVDRCWEYRRTW